MGRRKSGELPVQKVSIGIPGELLAKLDSWCESNGVSRSAAVQVAIARFLSVDHRTDGKKHGEPLGIGVIELGDGTGTMPPAIGEAIKVPCDTPHIQPKVQKATEPT